MKNKYIGQVFDIDNQKVVQEDTCYANQEKAEKYFRKKFYFYFGHSRYRINMMIPPERIVLQ